MRSLEEAVRRHCADLSADLVEMHLRRMPGPYTERCSPADIARHLRLLARVTPEVRIMAELRPLTGQAFEVSVVGEDHTGLMACMTAALTADGFNLEDVQVATYLENAPGTVEPSYYVVQLRVSGLLRGRSVADLNDGLCRRLQAAFDLVMQGRFLEAQAVAAGNQPTLTTFGQSTPMPPVFAPTSFSDLVLGGDFRLKRRLAIGGMSEVYLALQLSLNRTVAVKLIRHESPADDDLLARFLRESAVLGQFNCAYIVPVLAAGSVPHPAGGKLSWMAMEFLAGGDLGRWMQKQGPPPLELGLCWFRQALQGLLYAHRRHVLHRDLKPHNLLLTGDGQVKVSDFGLLKEVRQPGIGLTPRAAVLGTPHYMAPEQARGDPVDERSDIFSMGTTFFHVFSGHLPFGKSNPHAVVVQIANEPAPRLAEAAPDLPAPLSVVIGRMMAHVLEERYQDVEVVLDDLASYERRDLLRFTGTDCFMPAAALDGEALAETTLPYQSPVEGGGEFAI